MKHENNKRKPSDYATINDLADQLEAMSREANTAFDAVHQALSQLEVTLEVISLRTQWIENELTKLVRQRTVYGKLDRS